MESEVEAFYAVIGRADPALLAGKWRKLLRCRPLFRYAPGVRFVLVSGSMALGNPSEQSDFDVIIGCGEKRIFFTRLCLLALFSIWGLRRRSSDDKAASRDKFCFNHFVTEGGYALRPPRNIYWQELYKNLVPIYGDERDIIVFFRANAWAGRPAAEMGGRFLSRRPAGIVRIIEMFLHTKAGDWAEAAARRIQLPRILKKQSNVPAARPHAGPFGADAREHVSDTELEFHPDTVRIEEIIKKLHPS